MENFTFAISSNQADRAVNAVAPTSASITIVDQINGNRKLMCWHIVTSVSALVLYYPLIYSAWHLISEL
jgi:hypothetical protein